MQKINYGIVIVEKLSELFIDTIRMSKKHFLELWVFFAVFSAFWGLLYGAQWNVTGSLSNSRNGYEGAVLTDGRVMVLGGAGDPSGYEIFNPATGTWVRSSISVSSTMHTMAMLLPNGKVLYFTGSGVKIYNPLTNSWTNSAISVWWNDCYCATLLKNGKALLMSDGQSCRLYDYATDVATTTGSAITSHTSGVEVLLPTGKVMIIGEGITCELYDPGLGQWSSTSSMQIYRSKFVGVLLPPPWNKVLVASGGTSLQSEVYDINSGAWSYTGNLNSQRYVASMALLPSGKALIVGGSGSTSESYNPATGLWSTVSSMTYSPDHFSVAVLHTGKVLAAGGYSNVCEIYDESEGKWESISCINTKREAHTVTPLPIIHTTNCSTNVLIVGGENTTGALKSCELYNYADNRVSSTGDLNIARTHHTAVLLGSGEVFVAGGRNSGGSLKSCELYDASTEVWTPTGEMNEYRFDHTATLLQNGGDILITGGVDISGNYIAGCEIYSGGNWNNTGPLNTARTCHNSVILLNGKVLVIGGVGSGGILNSCELWNPSTGNWATTGNLNTGRYLHTAVLLQSGKVLVIGGKGTAGQLSSCELYDPATGNWSVGVSLNKARFLHNSTLLYSGLVLIAGGYDGSGCLSSCEIWDPATNKWKVTDSLTDARGYHSSVLIPGDKPYILAIGGENNGQLLNSIERYDIGLGYLTEWQSKIKNHQAMTLVSDSMHIEGELFRGVSEADGGNHCHIVSSDHPIVSLVRVGGGNFQGNGGGDILYMPLSSGWSETHTNIHPPVDALEGYYRLWSIVNGIPCVWYKECVEVEESANSKSQIQNPKLEIYPNPTLQVASIKYQVVPPSRDFASSTSKGSVNLGIYDITGRLVRTIYSGVQEAGNYEVNVGADPCVCPKTNGEHIGSPLQAGIYFIKLDTGGYKVTEKMTILK